MAKTKALISFTVTAKLICVLFFVYAKSRFSHNEAHLVILLFALWINYRHSLRSWAGWFDNSRNGNQEDRFSGIRDK